MGPSFGNRLQSARTAARLSRRQLGERIGKGETYIGKWERDEVVPPAEVQAQALAACREPAPDVARLMARFSGEIEERLASLAGDIETLLSQYRGANSPASDAVDSAAAAAMYPPAAQPSTRRPAGRARR